MIILNRKEDCCGCHACETVCPKKCITMREDAEGFLYPETDLSLCIDCHLCEKVCPVINAPARTQVPAPLVPDFLDEPVVYAARCCGNDLLQKSASGGAFTVIAEQVIREGGVVFGARWNSDFTAAEHGWTETLDGLSAFRGSKYLQSSIGNTYAKAREFLLTGRRVLFSGTPCQIAGLRRSLRRDFPNLLAVDIACHSTPSPKIWRGFFKELCSRERFSKIKNVNFRKKIFDAKRKTWSCASFEVEDVAGKAFCMPLYATPYGKAFGSGLISRPSCYECPSKNRSSGSDITIGDFWGIEKYFPSLNSAEGLSVIMCHTTRGNTFFEGVKPGFKILQAATYAQAVPKNGGFRTDTHRHPQREKFFDEFNAKTNSREHYDLIKKYTRSPFPRRLRNFTFRVIRFSLACMGLLLIVKNVISKWKNKL